MALREILTKDDKRLRTKCHKIEKFDQKLHTLLDDMAETMYNASGVGLAAPQVGIMRRVVVLDVGEGLVELINPVIIETEGEQEKVEGCLSCPNEAGYVKRPAFVKVKALDRHGNEFEISGKELLAICLCHEIDHLDGILYLDKVTKMVELDDMEEEE